MPNNTRMNQGVGGDLASSRKTSGGETFMGSGVCFATSLVEDAAVFNYVTPSTPLPVSIMNGTIFLGDGSITDAVCLQPDHTQLHATVYQASPWTVQFASGAEVDLASGAEVTALQAAPWAVTQSGSWAVSASQTGSWTVGVTGTVTVAGTVAVSGTTTVAGTVASTQSGTWNVASITNPVTLAALPAGTNTIGKTVASPDSNVIYVDGVPVPVKYALVSGSTSGASQVVPAVTGKRIRVVNFQLSADGTVAVKWQSGTTDLTGLTGMSQYVQTGATYCPVGVFQTAVGEALNLNRSAAVYVGGRVVYIEV